MASEWNAGTYYLPGQQAIVASIIYTATSTQPNQNRNPPSNPTWWNVATNFSVVVSATPEEWNAGTFYLPNQEVQWLSILYKATPVQPNRGRQPDNNPSWWLPSQTPGVTQIVAGSNITISPTNGLGAVTVNATVPSVPVNSVNGTGAGITVSPSTGDIYVSNTGVTSLVAGANITLSGSTGAVTINSVSSSYTAGTGITIGSGTGVIANSGVLSLSTTDNLIGISGGPTTAVGNITLYNQNPTGQLYCPVIRTTPWATAIGSYASGSRTDVMTSSAISTKQLWTLPRFTDNGGVYTIPMNTSACGLLLPGNLNTGGGYTFGRTLFGCSINGGTWMNTYNLGVTITVSATTYPDGSKGTIFGPKTLTAQTSVNEYGIVVNGSSIPSFLTVPVTQANSNITGSLGGYGYCVLTITYNWYNMNSDPGGNISYGGTPVDFGVNNAIDRALVSGGTFTLY